MPIIGARKIGQSIEELKVCWHSGLMSKLILVFTFYLVLSCTAHVLVITVALMLSPDFFSKLMISKDSFRNTNRVSNSKGPDQDRSCIGPDLGPNCSHRLSADDKSCR